MSDKRLAIMLLTYNRPEYAKITLERCLENLKFSGELKVHIADDGSDDFDAQIESLSRIAGDLPFSWSNSERGGYGRNYNLATQTVHSICEYVLPLEEDWKLNRELDADGIIADIDELELGCVRLGYLGWTQKLQGWFVKSSRQVGYIQLDPESTEPHVFSGHPRIETVQWEREVGLWPEGYTPGSTEFEVSIKLARHNIAWPIDLTRTSGDIFSHFGDVRAEYCHKDPYG